jgi:probable rRNA maturation factor
VEFARQGAGVPAGVEEQARRAAALVLRRGRAPRGSVVTVVWTTRERVRALNRRFRGVDRFTDVISFRYEDGPESGVRSRGSGRRPPGSLRSGRPDSRTPRPPDARPPFGDLYVAVPQARMNARRFGVPFREELVRLAAHGALHLLGHSDYVLSAKRRLWRAQEAALRRVFGRAPAVGEGALDRPQPRPRRRAPR